MSERFRIDSAALAAYLNYRMHGSGRLVRILLGSITSLRPPRDAGAIAQDRKSEMARTHGWNLLQFSLRTTFVLTLLAAVYISYLVQLDSNRKRLVQEIEAAGGNVTVDDTLFSIFSTERITAVSLPYDSIHEIGACRLLVLPKLTTLSLTDVEMTSNDGTQLQTSELKLTKLTKTLLESIDLNQELKRER